MDTISARWRNARKATGKNQTDLASALGMSQTQMSSYENGTEPPLSSIRAFSAICGVRESYLLNGDLPILEPPREQTPVQRIVEELNLPPICAAALEEWILMPESEQEIIKRRIQATIDRHNAQHPPDDTEKSQ